MDDAELDRLEKLANEATPGPWFVNDCHGTSDGYCWYLSIDRESTADEKLHGAPGKMTMFATSSVVKLDADFIAAAREAIPKLIAALRAERELIDRMNSPRRKGGGQQRID